MSRTIHFVPVEGRVAYGAGLEWQRRLAAERIAGSLPDDVVLLLEHDPVVTLGRSADGGHLVAPPERLDRAGVERFEVERGGDVTYHGPGQLVGYPILDLAGYRNDLHWYLRTLEGALIEALSLLGLRAGRAPGYTGVWVGEAPAARASRGAPPGPRDVGEPAPNPALAEAVRAGRLRKIASIGVHVSRWITWHGFALNVTEEALRGFRLIVPCGIPDVRMTSLASEGARSGEDEVREALAAGFARAFGADVRLLPPVFPGGGIDLGIGLAG